MNEVWVEKFENYFQNKMKAEDKQEFEAELASDKEMQEAFSLFKAIETDMRYLSTSEEESAALRSTLKNLNEKYIKSNPDSPGETVPFGTRKRNIIYTVLAVALIFIFVSYAVYLGQDSANMPETANEYFAANLQQLGQTMGSSPDSMQLGIAAYNRRDYALAQTYFEGLLDQQQENAEAIKYLGLAYMANVEFDQALRKFDSLAQREDLLNNPGLFLQALTLLIRNENGDQELAKSKLEQVVASQSEGKERAAEWLEEFN